MNCLVVFTNLYWIAGLSVIDTLMNIKKVSLLAIICVTSIFLGFWTLTLFTVHFYSQKLLLKSFISWMFLVLLSFQFLYLNLWSISRYFKSYNCNFRTKKDHMIHIIRLQGPPDPWLCQNSNHTAGQQQVPGSFSAAIPGLELRGSESV